ncbi:MAG: TAXI family TRAP transporter solute-binding subunit [Hydrogenoanaerobacterium sp.]
MKKIISILLVATLALGLCACGGSAQKAVKLTTGGESGTYYAFGGVIAQVITDNVDKVKAVANTSGASGENCRLVNKGEAQLGIVQNDVLSYAYQGINTFAKDGAMTNLATVATLYPEVVQIVVAADSGINTIADMKGKAISVGDAGSGVETNAIQTFEAYGMTFNDIDARHLSFKESSQAVQDKQIEGFFCVAGVPNTAIQELSTTRKIKVISIEPAQADAMIAKYPFYGKVDIKKDVYNTEEDGHTLAVMATLICSKDADETLIYNITKSLFENKPQLEAHAKGKEVTLEGAVKSISIDIHPGAAKYYKEKGVL